MKIYYSCQSAMKQLGVEKLRDYQIKPINRILNGKDTMVIAPTSAGKSLIYQLPALVNNDKLTLVIEPTLSLMHDQVQRLKQRGVQAEYIDSSLSGSEWLECMDQLSHKRTTLLYVTPEKLPNLNLAGNQIGMIVIDECHCVLDWGYSFREAYLKIGVYIKSLQKRPIMPLSIIDYYQQAGRAGRQGQQAHCILLYSDDDYYVDKAILESIEHFPARQKALLRLDDMRDFCQDVKHCMVKVLLSELGEEHAKDCNHCTNCQKARRHK